jgi:signal transduction histidine kinase
MSTGNPTGAAPEGVRVLVVDDDPVLCRQLAAGLAQSGYQVLTAHDGDSVISQAQDTPPDVAIVDLGMPTGGLAVIRHLKGLHGAAVHVIVMTGDDAGTNDFIVKPTSLAEIRRRLAAAAKAQRAYVDVRIGKEAADRRMTYGVEASALLAHDLNNGLAVALSNVSYLLDTLKLEDPDASAALASTLRSLRRMSGLVANFVDIARFEDAAVKPIVASVRIKELLESVMEVNSVSIQRGVTFAVDCDPALEAMFYVALVERVLHNLVGNASRYCTQGGQIAVLGRPGPFGAEGSCELEVLNSGPPVPEAIRSTLFGKYTRGTGGKRGMGLYFCRLVAEAHGGSIEYETRPQGPAFVIRLPGRA